MMQKLVFILFLGSQTLLAQLPADTVRYDAAITVAQRGDEKAQLQTQLDSALVMPLIDADMGELLSKRTTGHILQYGPAGTASSVRQGGLAADHFTVAWHGLSLNSITLGQADMSLFPVFLLKATSQANRAPQ